MLGVIRRIARDGEDFPLGLPDKAQAFSIHLGQIKRCAPADDVGIVVGLAGVDQVEPDAVGEPTLLRGAHEQRLAVVPGPGMLGLPLEPVLRGGNVSAIIFGTNGHVESAVQARHGGFEQTPAGGVAELVSTLDRGECLSVEGAAKAAHGPVFATLRPPGAGQDDVPVVQMETLSTAAGVDLGHPWIAVLELVSHRPAAIRLADGVHGPTLTLGMCQHAILVVDVVTDAQQSLALEMPGRDEVADALLPFGRFECVPAKRGNLDGLGPGCAEVG